MHYMETVFYKGLNDSLPKCLFQRYYRELAYLEYIISLKNRTSLEICVQLGLSTDPYIVSHLAYSLVTSQVRLEHACSWLFKSYDQVPSFLFFFFFVINFDLT